MLKYSLVLVATLLVEILVSAVAFDFMLYSVTSETSIAMIYVFTGPVAAIVMGLTVAMFDRWRCRIVVANYLESRGFRASRG